MPDKSPLDTVIREVVALEMKAVDDYVQTIAETLVDLGNPEKLIGKKYEEWDINDLNILSSIYSPEKLNDFIFNKEFKRTQELEAEEV